MLINEQHDLTSALVTSDEKSDKKISKNSRTFTFGFLSNEASFKRLQTSSSYFLKQTFDKSKINEGDFFIVESSKTQYLAITLH